MSWFTGKKISADFDDKDVLNQLKTIDRSIKTQTEMTAMRLDSIKRSVDMQAVALIAISKLLAILCQNPHGYISERDSKEIIDNLAKEIEWIKTFTNNTGE